MTCRLCCVQYKRHPSQSDRALYLLYFIIAFKDNQYAFKDTLMIVELQNLFTLCFIYCLQVFVQFVIAMPKQQINNNILSEKIIGIITADYAYMNSK